MKNFIIGLSTLFISTFSHAYTYSQVDNHHFNYNVTIQTSGVFSITINQLFDNLSPAKAMNKLFLNSTLQANIDDKVDSMKSSLTDLGNKAFSNGNYSYNSTVSAAKFGLTVNIENKCNLSVTSSKITNDCSITKSKYLVFYSIFDHGKTKTVCNKRGQGSSCTTAIIGKANPIKVPGKKRSSARLALSGASHTLTTMYRAYTNVLYGPNYVYKVSSFYDLNLKTFWSDLSQYYSNDIQTLESGINAYSTRNGLVKRAF